MPLRYTDYYDVLGVPRDADTDLDPARVPQAGARVHPDLNSDSDAEERFKELGEAYEVLSDADKRERYDRLGTVGAKRSARRLRRASRTSSLTSGSTRAVWSSARTCSRRCSGRAPTAPTARARP